MRIFALTLALLPTFACQAWSQDDGLYLVSENPTDTSIDTLDGRSLFLGQPFPEKIDEVTLISQTNDNSAYQINLKQNKPYTKEAAMRGIALVLQKKCLNFSGCGGDNTHREYSTQISDRDFINLAATFFKITPQDRHHPGHQFTARFVVNPDGYAFAEPVEVTFCITNCGAQPFWIEQPGIPSGMLDVFSFTGYGWGPEWNVRNNAVWNRPYSPGPIDMMTQTMEIKPQETRSIPVNLSDYMAINKRGTYGIRGTYAFKVMDSGAPYRVLWDDFATAEFRVKIK